MPYFLLIHMVVMTRMREVWTIAFDEPRNGLLLTPPS
jgi:hypothetical protein